MPGVVTNGSGHSTKEVVVTTGATEAIAAAILAAGYEAPVSNSFSLEATLKSGEVVTVKVSGYLTIRQGCAALVKLADVNTLSQIIANSENDEDWS